MAEPTERGPQIQPGVRCAAGAAIKLQDGGVATLPAGTKITWHITAPFRQFWTLSGKRAPSHWPD